MMWMPLQTLVPLVKAKDSGDLEVKQRLQIVVVMIKANIWEHGAVPQMLARRIQLMLLAARSLQNVSRATLAFQKNRFLMWIRTCHWNSAMRALGTLPRA